MTKVYDDGIVVPDEDVLDVIKFYKFVEIICHSEI